MSTYTGESTVVSVSTISGSGSGGGGNTIYTTPSGFYAEISFIGASYTFSGGATSPSASIRIGGYTQVSFAGLTVGSAGTVSIGNFTLNEGNTINLLAENQGIISASFTVKLRNKP
jgi:hypothetical protein